MILTIIQARMSSTRLPGKVLLPIANKPMLYWTIRAAKQTPLVDKVIVATSNTEEDERLRDYALHYVDVLPGDLHDVLGRFYLAALCYSPTHIVRLTADCPMVDPEIIDKVISAHLYGDYDYTTNSGFQGSYPDGQDVEVFTMKTLTRAAKLATKPYDREHVTSFMRNRQMFNIGRVYCKNAGNKKYSVDTKEDYERVKEEMECLLARRSSLNVH